MRSNVIRIFAVCFIAVALIGCGKSDAEKAAEQKKNAEAQYNLALKYLKGDGVSKDNNKAAELLKNAATQGHVESQLALFSMYEPGIFWQELFWHTMVIISTPAYVIMQYHVINFI